MNKPGHYNYTPAPIPNKSPGKIITESGLDFCEIVTVQGKVTARSTFHSYSRNFLKSGPLTDALKQHITPGNVIVVDFVADAELLCHELGVKMITGRTPTRERMEILDTFNAHSGDEFQLSLITTRSMLEVLSGHTFKDNVRALHWFSCTSAGPSVASTFAWLQTPTFFYRHDPMTAIENAMLRRSLARFATFHRAHERYLVEKSEQC